MDRKPILRFAGALIVTALRLAAQPVAPAFEVASIRVHQPPLHTITGFTLSGPRVTMEGYTIPQMLIEAYGLKGYWQTSLGKLTGTDEMQNIYYDIVARAPENRALTRDDARKMLQALLKDRFHLTVHRDMKEVPVYALVPGKNASKLKEVTAEGRCAINMGVVTGGQRHSFVNCGIDALVGMLSNGLVDRPVIDKTQLTAKYNFRLDAMPDFMNRNRSDPTDLSPFTAVEDLGLKLIPQTAAMEVIVVDRVEKPTEN